MDRIRRPYEFGGFDHLFLTSRHRARLPALYSDFQSQRAINPDGYQANVSAWRKALSQIPKSGLAPSPRSGSPNVLVLNCDEQLLRALESKQYGRPLALGAVLQEALAAKDLMPVAEFRAAKDNIYHQPWSVWGVAAWTMRQLGVADMLRSDKLPNGQFVVLANVEETAKAFGDKNTAESRLERTFSKTQFRKTFTHQLVEGRQLSEVDMDILLTFLSRDKGAILYDGNTIKIKAPGEQQTSIGEEDTSIAQLRELIQYLTHQTAILNARVDELSATAKEAVAKKNRVAALAALKSKKLTETTLAQRFTTLSQLEEVAAKIEQAADNVAVVRVMQSSTAALKTLNAAVGGAEGVEEVVDHLREQMGQADEVNSIMAESSGVVIDEAELDDELAALEGEEKGKEEEAARREAELAELQSKQQEALKAEETRKLLESAGSPSSEEPIDQTAMEMSRISLEESSRPQAAS